GPVANPGPSLLFLLGLLLRALFGGGRLFACLCSRSLLRTFGAGSGSFRALFLLFLDHLHLGGGAFGGGSFSRFLGFANRRGNRDDRNMLVAQNLYPGGRLDVADVNRLANFQVG